MTLLKKICPICDRKAGNTGDGSGKRRYECNVCGEYIITQEATDDLFEKKIYKEARPKISAYLRQREINKLPLIQIFSDKSKVDSKDENLVISINEIINWFPKSISERTDRTLLNISKLSKFTGDNITIEENDYPIFYVDNIHLKALFFMLKTLSDAEYLYMPELKVPARIRLTAKGWDRVTEIENNKNYLSKQAFVAMWFKDSLDKIYESGIKKAIEEAGYTPMRIKESEHNNKICDQIIAEIRKSKFVICDFTGQRGGVYFEAGFTMGLGRPVIWTCKKGETENLHFDTRQYNHIEWEDENDLYEKLFNRIKATII